MGPKVTSSAGTPALRMYNQMGPKATSGTGTPACKGEYRFIIITFHSKLEKNYKCQIPDRVKAVRCKK
jgi:hypothetical protein